MGYAGYNTMHPYNWFASAGDPVGDVSFAHVNQHNGNFWNQQGGSGTPTAGGFSGSPGPDWYPTTGMVTTGGGAVDYTNPAYISAAMMQPGVQAPAAGSPALMMGNASTGPVAYSDYASGNLPSAYVSPMPAWKNAPMQRANARLPHAVQNAAAMSALQTNVPQNTGPLTALHTQSGAAVNSSAAQQVQVQAAAQQAAQQAVQMAGAGGCSGCSGGCGGSRRAKYCKGKNTPVGLDSTIDFLPPYSHHTANAAQVTDSYLYHTTSNSKAGWTVSQGAAPDHSTPLQGE